MLSSKSIWMLAAATAFLASPAQAQDVTGTQQEPGTAPGTSVELNVPLATEAPRIVTVDPDATLSDNELGDLRGGEGIIVTNQTLVAITSGNVINGNYVAGNVSLSDFSLSNFNGLGNVLINTGAQVSLQTGMNVTINVGN